MRTISPIISNLKYPQNPGQDQVTASRKMLFWASHKLSGTHAVMSVVSDVYQHVVGSGEKQLGLDTLTLHKRIPNHSHNTCPGRPDLNLELLYILEFHTRSQECTQSQPMNLVPSSQSSYIQFPIPISFLQLLCFLQCDIS